MLILPDTPDAWEQARAALQRGGLVVVPTDTVYGVACDPYNPEAIRSIYAAKSRDSLKALPLLLAGVESVSAVAGPLPDAAVQLGSAFWPGALTLVVPRSPGLPVELGGGETIAVRVPNQPHLQAFIASCGGAIAATSANLSGQPDALTAQQGADYLGAFVEIVIDGGPAPGGVPSTVVNCLTDPPAVLRAGAITEQQIRIALEQGNPRSA